ncbi:DUF2793 domain-containing protein [Parasedimentitalea huanghaiensis]|uniref:DUF2793 domain-containing protein n=1 Tax=Parasedimentitalea huanghaiensis TaxID=2682100 RepID=A0A6L6WKZ3_9RHOB|nr:DUF2793 domain-containing protein [Zongyanglinia huanghaiensis]MVO18513.1 DUF2793 domain-containing protein [Zongyanglinia huanghaiensis]
MSQTSPVLSLPFLMPSQAQKHVTHNEALLILDAVSQLNVRDLSLSAPPELPDPGDRYIVAEPGSGAWAGHGTELAFWDGATWHFFVPQSGWQATVDPLGQGVRFDGTDWLPVQLDLQNLPALGIAATADDDNRLTVASAATLLTHVGAGHQVKVNKASATDTASLLFQTNWSGRAEMGTAGGDEFAIKVSPDGSQWLTALSVTPTTGQVSFPQGSPMLRERLTAPRSYYVRPDGADSNDGLADTAEAGFLTLQHAVDQALALDCGPHDVQIQLAAGAYGEEVVLQGPLLGSGSLLITGHAADPTMVTTARILARRGAVAVVTGLQFTGSDGLQAETGARIHAAALSFAGSGAAMMATDATLSCEGESLSIGAGIDTLARLRQRARLEAGGGSMTLASGITWGSAGGIDLSEFSLAGLSGVTFDGDTAGCSGPRYQVAQNAILQTNGAGSSFIPGSVAGTVTSGGQYL